MAVSENDAHYGHRLRVYRKFGNTVYDKVFYLTENGKPVSKKKERQIRAAAKAWDKELAQYQKDYEKEQAEKNPVKFHKNGKIVGLVRNLQSNNNRLKDIFELRIRLKDDSVCWGSISIDLYGFDEAYAQAISRITDVLNINKRTKIYRKMKNAKSAYS